MHFLVDSPFQVLYSIPALVEWLTPRSTSAPSRLEVLMSQAWIQYYQTAPSSALAIKAMEERIETRARLIHEMISLGCTNRIAYGDVIRLMVRDGRMLQAVNNR